MVVAAALQADKFFAALPFESLPFSLPSELLGDDGALSVFP